MKNIFIILFNITLVYKVAFSWDPEIAKYFPLQIGNVWVYSSTEGPYPYCYGSFYAKYRVSGTIDSIGKKYYILQESFYRISGNCVCSISMFLHCIRIDSASMNVYGIISNSCNMPEMLIDSLCSKLNDTAKICSTNQFSLCNDTSLYNFFNMNLPSKRFNHDGRGNGTFYVKDLGIASWGYGEAQTSCIHILKGCVINGVVKGDTSTIVGINLISTEIPEHFSLSQNYPNPFNPTTKIKFVIPPVGNGRDRSVKVIVYDELGREVQTLLNEPLQPGTYEVEWDGSNFSSGVYYYSLQTENFNDTKKMVLLK
jgi:type IX secretion system substrate protein